MERPAFNYDKLRGRIVEKFGSQKKFSVAMHMSQATLTARMTGALYFSQDEIARANQLLGIEREAISDYFFTTKV